MYFWSTDVQQKTNGDHELVSRSLFDVRGSADHLTRLLNVSHVSVIHWRAKLNDPRQHIKLWKLVFMTPFTTLSYWTHDYALPISPAPRITIIVVYRWALSLSLSWRNCLSVCPSVRNYNCVICLWHILALKIACLEASVFMWSRNCWDYGLTLTLWPRTT